MKKCLAIVFLLMSVFPLMAEEMTLSVPEDFQGMWKSTDEYNLVELIEIDNDNIYLYGISIFTLFNSPLFPVLDISTRENQNSYTITVKVDEQGETVYVSLIFALENESALTFCLSYYYASGNDLPYGEIYTYERIGQAG